MIFVDSSAFLAVLSMNDANRQRARACWGGLIEDDRTLLTNNYVIVESMALVKNRLGLGKVRDFQENLLPFLEIEWVGEEQHILSVQRVLTAGRRRLSLVDCSAFETMRRMDIETAFTFDTHFRDEGFRVIP